MTRPALKPDFSGTPTGAEIQRARVFAEPLMPIGGMPSDVENRALVAAIQEYQTTGNGEAVGPFLRFLTRYPFSVWRPSLMSNVGRIYEQYGYFSKAQHAWDEAWAGARSFDDAGARTVAEDAISRLMDLTSKFGDTERLSALLAALGDRRVQGASAERVALAREAVALLESHHELATPSGPLALQQLLNLADSTATPHPLLESVHATPSGMAMPELRQLATKVGLRLRLARRTPGAALMAASVVHLRVGHFAAIVAVSGERVLLRDPILGGDIWMSMDAIDEEASGYFLVPQGSLPKGWRDATDNEVVGLRGRCGLGLPAPEDEGGPSCANPCAAGMPAYDFHTLQVGLRIYDTPVGYAPSIGPRVDFLVRYNQRDQFQPGAFTYSNLGPKWTFDFLSYVTDNPTALSNDVKLYPRGGGGEHRYTGYDSVTGSYGAHWRSVAPLVRTSADPIRYERRLPDGSIEVFAQPDGASTMPRRIFMTEFRDPQGHTLTFTYDASLRMVAITDAMEQVTTIAYELAHDPLKITTVTDPFGRSARFTYNAVGELHTITDVIGLTSNFRYGLYSFVAGMTTPYGTTTFRGEITGGSARWLEATDPIGGTERIEYVWSSASLPHELAASDVPTGFADRNAYLERWNTAYWDKQAHAQHPGDLNYAVLTRWVRNTLNNYVLGVPHSIKRPLESRVWFRYPDEVWPNYRGRLTTPSAVGRVLDDGTSQIWETDYNTQGAVTARRDPLGRETSFSYAANGIDLLDVHQTTGAANDLLASFANYNSQHLPGTLSDAPGQATTLTYNTAGQILTATNAKLETTTWAYDPQKRLASVTGPVAGATTTLGYDAYGRVRTMTTAEGDTTTVDYDLFDRPVQITYPDSTAEDVTYHRLDVATRTDRRGRLTRFLHDPLRQLVRVRDPQGRTVKQEWGPGGLLQALIDAKAQPTTWTYDAVGRVAQEVRGGTATTAYTYEAATSRLKTVTDPKGQVTTLSYAPDNALLTRSYTNETNSTPDVTYTYDTIYPRVATMADGIGTTTYSYKAPGELGAGAVASIDGPRVNDTLTYTYDELGRVVARALDGIGVSWAFDALGRTTSEGTPLGTFTYTYDGVTGRVASATYPNNQTSTYSYFGAVGDRRLQTIHHKTPSATTLSKFDYTYDAVGNIQTWTQQADASAPTQWTYGYDAADQLTSAIKRTAGGTPTVLASYGYRYDPAGNRTSEQVGDVVTGATHDAANRLLTHTPAGALRVAGTLTEAARVTIDGAAADVDSTNSFAGVKQLTAGTNTFTVAATDMAGNTTTKTYEVDAAGASRTFTYDANGNTISDGTRTFEWDAEDRLLAVVDGTHRSEFTYDGESRRVRIVEKESGATVRDAALFWAGAAIIEERLSTGEVTRFFGAAEQHNGAARYVTRDHLGSVREVTTATGVVVTRNDYDPYGRLTRVAGSEDSRFGYTGHYTHAPTALALTLYRAYDPNLGRWLSSDPIREAGGINLFAYVRGNPAGLIDPLGLWDLKAGVRGFLDGGRDGFFAWSDGVNPFGDWYADMGYYDRCASGLAASQFFGAVSFNAVLAMIPIGALNGGAKSVFWSGGEKAMLEAATRGITLEQTLGGSVLGFSTRALAGIVGKANAYWLTLPVWAAASAIYALNASGPVQTVIHQPGRIWTYVERPILLFMGRL